MTYYIAVELTINNDEVEQEHPTQAQMTDAIYAGRIVPEGIIFNLLEVSVVVV